MWYNTTMGQKVFAIILLLIMAPATVYFAKEAYENSDDELVLYAVLTGFVALTAIATLIR